MACSSHWLTFCGCWLWPILLDLILIVLPREAFRNSQLTLNALYFPIIYVVDESIERLPNGPMLFSIFVRYHTQKKSLTLWIVMLKYGWRATNERRLYSWTIVRYSFERSFASLRLFCSFRCLYDTLQVLVIICEQWTVLRQTNWHRVIFTIYNTMFMLQ